MKRIYFFTVIFVLVFTACDKTEIPDDDEPNNNQTEFQQKLLDLVNDARTSGCDCGGEYQEPTTAIVWNDTLAAVAEAHSQDMNDNNYFDHTNLDGESPGDRIRNAGYDWSTYGENIANGYPDEDAVIRGWLDSPGHCRNIMNPAFSEMGVGKSGTYWTQVFGAK